MLAALPQSKAATGPSAGDNVHLMAATPQSEFRWLTIDELQQAEDQWCDLADNAARPNPYYGPAILLAYHRSIGIPGGVRIASVWSGEGTRARLDALAFYVRRDLRWGWPVKTWVTWGSSYFVSTEPLVRETCELQARKALFYGLSNARKDRTLLLGKAFTASSADPMRLLDERLDGQSILDRQSTLDRQAVVDNHERAVLLRGPSPEQYEKSGLSRKFRQNVRRSIRKLEELGNLEFKTVTAGPELLAAGRDFIDLEDRSWKGKQGSSLKSRPKDLKFAELAFASRSVPHISCDVLSLDGQAIAINVNMTVGNRLYGFKSAYDETYRKLSPGSVAHYMAAQSLLRNDNLIMADSSTVPGHPIESIWPDRLACGRVLQSIGAPVPQCQFDHALAAERLRLSVRAHTRDLYNTLIGRKVTVVKQAKPCDQSTPDKK